ncbi:MAG: phage baseplate assembly protein V [Allosphingosinicella sp.]
MTADRYFGLYRGTVSNNVDPMLLGRLQVKVPSVPGASELSWAMPCTGYGGSSVGFFALPPVGTNVWVQFEEGDSSAPVWMGVFWDSATRPPADPPVELMKVFKTSGITVTITDTPGAAMFEIKTASGAKIGLGPTGIEIDNGMGASIKLQGPQTSVNGGALEVV